MTKKIGNSAVVKSIFSRFPVSNEEFYLINEKYGKLANFSANQLHRNNLSKNQCFDKEDYNQDFAISLITAASYYKRQQYIIKCLKLSLEYVKDDFTRQVLINLSELWDMRKHHGAGKTKFGFNQENLLYSIMRRTVPKKLQPKKDAPLEVDDPLWSIYAKSILWNCWLKTGKGLKKDLHIRANSISLSDCEFLTKGSDE